MRTYRQWLDYQELELISTPQAELKRKLLRVLSVLKKIGSSLLAALTAASELRIWQTVDDSGNLWWHVYDPKTKQSIQMASEEELRIWIDESFSRQRTLPTPNWMPYHFPHPIRPF